MSDPVSEQWKVEYVVGTAEEVFLGIESSASLLQTLKVKAALRFVTVTRSALVLGSAQSPDVVDVAEQSSLGFDVVTRRSGGGAVWLDPVEQVWVDVIVPVDHTHWLPDVGRSFEWLGKVWALTLCELGIARDRITVHDGAMKTSVWSDLLCFAGVGPGEVFVDGRKVVGIAQRRSRNAALFQCGLLLHWDVNPSLFSAHARIGLNELDVQQVGVGIDEILGRAVKHAEVESAFTRNVQLFTIGGQG